MARVDPKIPFFLTFAIFLFLLVSVIQNFVDIPVWDQWQFVETLDKFYAGTLSFADLIELHHEHRIVFPRIVMLFLASISGWNIGYEITANLLLGIAIFVGFAILASRTFDKKIAPHYYWLFPVLAVFVFSLRQVQNWLWGWQISIFLNVASVCFGLMVLARCGQSHLGYVAGLLLGIVATFSFANGLLYWGLGLVVLAAQPGASRSRLLIWLLVTLLITSLYFLGFERSSADPSIAHFIGNPLSSIYYVLIWLGSLLVFTKSAIVYSAFLGALAVASLVYSSIIILRNGEHYHRLVVFWALSAYSIASACVSAAGRVGFGVDQALASRYTTIALPMWCSVVLLLFYAYEANKRSHTGSTSLSSGLRKLPVIVLFCFTLFAGVASFQFRKDFEDRKAILLPVRAELQSYPKIRRKKMLRLICWSPELVLKSSEILQRNGLSVFREK